MHTGERKSQHDIIKLLAVLKYGSKITQHVKEVTIFWLEYLSYKKKKPFFRQASHVKAWLSGKSYLKFLFQIHLLASNLQHVVLFANN